MSKPKPLPERILELRAEIDSFIDARVAEIKKTCPGVPEGAIRNTIVRSGCQCSAYLELAERDEAQKGAA
ncbi:hypothetical protein WHZ78_17580 [Bradyrhizobium symbiodeficiens]|uniref:hypothetical protein n=1 Tax=Bradyrhizobium symbiodeficiens TaxID=1404367 RepID=UPI0030D52339